MAFAPNGTDVSLEPRYLGFQKGIKKGHQGILQASHWREDESLWISVASAQHPQILIQHRRLLSHIDFSKMPSH